MGQLNGNVHGAKASWEAVARTLAVRIREAKADPDFPRLLETGVRQVLILPVLQDLGWRTDKTAEVFPDYPSGRGTVDLALRNEGRAVVFLQVEKAGHDLGFMEDSFRQSAVQEGVSLVVLTDGFRWSFYLPMEEAKWATRPVCEVDFGGDEEGRSAELLMRLLERETVRSGMALSFAKERLDEEKRSAAIRRALATAWEELVAEGDEILLELLAQKVKDLSGAEPRPEEVRQFLRHGLRVEGVEEENRSWDRGYPSQEPAGGAYVPSQQLPVREGDAPRIRVSQEELMMGILRVLAKRGGSAPKSVVEQALYRQYQAAFDQPYYQEPVSHGVPRWKHNIAWAKEAAKHQGYVKRPKEAGYGIWSLTEEGWQHVRTPT